MAEKDRGQLNSDELLDRAVAQGIRLHRKGKLRNVTGDGLVEDNPLAPIFKKMGGAAYRFIADRAYEEKKKGNGKTFDSDEADFIDLLHNVLGRKVNEFTGASFPDSQKDFVQSHSITHYQSPEVVLGSLISTKLGNDAIRIFMKRIEKANPDKNIFKNGGGLVARDRELGMMLVKSKEFELYKNALIEKYSKPGKDGKIPEFDELDFHPYTWGGNIINSAYKAEHDKKVLSNKAHPLDKVPDIYSDFDTDDYPGSISFSILDKGQEAVTDHLSNKVKEANERMSLQLQKEIMMKRGK